jgi:hypothetical protein
VEERRAINESSPGSRAQLGGYENAHYSVVVDYFTPLRPDGTPYYDEVWLTMMGGGSEGVQTPTLSTAAAILFAAILFFLPLWIIRRSRSVLPNGGGEV